jgi:transcriptional repressor of cell division inhibition gene dicB
MDKATAIEMLGGTAASAARAIGVSPAAVNQWPRLLPARIADRVQAALWRAALEKKGRPGQPEAVNLAVAHEASPPAAHHPHEAKNAQ